MSCPPNWLVGLLFAVIWSALIAPAWASNEAPCKQLFQQKQFEQAGLCFLKLMDPKVSPQGQGNQALLFDRLLRNAAFSFHQASRQNISIEQKSFLLERAASLLMQSFQKGYCEASDRCHTNRSIAERYKSKIGYATLAVITGKPNSVIKVEGYKYQHSEQASFQQSLRPGTYRISISTPNQSTVLQKTIQLAPHQSSTLDATTPKVRWIQKTIRVQTKLPVIVWIGYFVGGAMVVAGVALLAFGISSEQDVRAALSDPIKARMITDEEARQRVEQARALQISGGVVGGAGLVGVIGALIGQLSVRSASPRKISLQPPPQFQIFATF